MSSHTKRSTFPKFLAPIANVVAMLDPFQDKIPAKNHLARLRSFRDALLRTVGENLRVYSGWSQKEILARGLAYVDAVESFITTSSSHFPVDSLLVATNDLLIPRLRTTLEDFSPSQASKAAPLISLSGSLYADPISILISELYPARVTRVLRAFGKQNVCDIAEAAKVTSANFCWAEGKFPFAAAFLEDGSLALRGANRQRRWTIIRSQYVPKSPLIEFIPRPSELKTRETTKPVLRRYREETSSLKGARGEAEVFDILNSRKYSVERVSHKARSADLVVTTSAGAILVETKSYSISVPEKEVKKFRRDLGARGAVSGVLVSLSSGIVGIKTTIAAKLEALPIEGRVAPIIYVSSRNPDVITAAIDLATYLAKVFPGTSTAKTLHSRDALEAYVADLEEIADVYEGARSDMKRLSTTISDGFGDALEKFSGALRDHRKLARVQRLAIESPEMVEGTSSEVWKKIDAKYPVPKSCRIVLADLLSRLSETNLGDIRKLNQWKFLRQKVVHTVSGISISFLKTRTDLCVAVEHVGGKRVGELVSKHPKKVRVANGQVCLELGDDTAADALAVI